MRVGLILAAVVIPAFLLAGCEAAPEYVASARDFRDYESWRVIDYSIGQANPLLGGAHRGGDERYSRRVYLRPGSVMKDSAWAVGTIILKETFTWEDSVRRLSPSDGVLAMVKRGRRFNPRGSGWEWFSLSENGRIVSRGGDRVGMCNVCHRYAVVQDRGMDFVFAAPTEFEYDGRDLLDHRHWPQVDQLRGRDPFLTHIRDVHDSLVTRRVYKKQLLANPDTDSLGYPIGTVFLKEILRRGYVVAILARAKRGGGFNPDNGGWEWFVVDPASFVIRERGASAAEDACNRCHQKANSPGKGRDFVFRHPGDPFNR